jgi:hypothetical protein
MNILPLKLDAFNSLSSACTVDPMLYILQKCTRLNNSGEMAELVMAVSIT